MVVFTRNRSIPPQHGAEQDIEEVPHRLGRFHHLGPQDRPFPAGEYEAGRYGRIDSAGKFVPFLGLGQASSKPFPPQAEDLVQAGAEAFVVFSKSIRYSSALEEGTKPFVP